MKPSCFLLVVALAPTAAGLLPGRTVCQTVPPQDCAPPPAQAPDEATLKAIAAKAEKLGDRLQKMRRNGLRDPNLAEVEIYYKAALWITRHNEFYHKDAADWTLETLDRGLVRVRALEGGEAAWLQQTGRSVLRAYRSRIDGSVQPYAATLPASYGKDPNKKWRIDIVLHGRDTSLTEVKFLHAHNGDRPAANEQGYIQIHIYGRGNNAYR